MVAHTAEGDPIDAESDPIEADYICMNLQSGDTLDYDHEV